VLYEEESMTSEKKPKEPDKIPEPVSEELMDKATKAAERLENANKELGELLNRQEEMQVEKTLSGEASAGDQEKSDEDKAKESAKALLQGTGHEDLFD